MKPLNTYQNISRAYFRLEHPIKSANPLKAVALDAIKLISYCSLILPAFFYLIGRVNTKPANDNSTSTKIDAIAQLTLRLRASLTDTQKSILKNVEKKIIIWHEDNKGHLHLNDFDLDDLIFKILLIENSVKLKAFTRIALMGNHLTTLPDEFFEMKNLAMLLLDGNNLTEIPKKIDQLAQLEYLEISNNYRLKKLPESLKDLKRLSFIGIENTQILENERNAILEACRA